MAFDLGVFLTVVGVVHADAGQSSRVEPQGRAEPAPEGPMDIRSCRAGPLRAAARGADPLRSPNRPSGRWLRWKRWWRARRAADRGRDLSGAAAHDFPVVLGLTFLSYAVNVYLFAMGRLVVGRPPIVSSRTAGLHRPAAPGAGADRDRDLVRHDRAARRAGAARLSRDRPDEPIVDPALAPAGRPATARRRSMNHWIIAARSSCRRWSRRFCCSAARYDI